MAPLPRQPAVISSGGELTADDLLDFASPPAGRSIWGIRFGIARVTGVARTSRFIVAGVLLVAVVSKFIAMEEFAEVTSTLTIVPRPIRQVLPVLIPLAELVVTYALVLPGLRRIGVCAAAVMLLAFSGYLAWAVAHPWAPACNCLGLLALAGDAHTHNLFSLLRNVVLLCLLGVAMLEPNGAAPAGGSLPPARAVDG